MAATLKIDTRDFIFALRAYKAATQKDEAEILNKRGRNIAFRAASFTKKGSPVRIRSALMRDPHLRFALASILLRKRGIGKLKAPAFAKAVQSLVAHRVGSANYLRAAWAQAVHDLGGTFKGSRLRGASGFANKATVAKLLTQIVAITSQPNNAHARSAESIGMIALQRAIDHDTADMLEFCRQQMGLTAKKFSSKK